MTITAHWDISELSSSQVSEVLLLKVPSLCCCSAAGGVQSAAQWCGGGRGGGGSPQLWPAGWTSWAQCPLEEGRPAHQLHWSTLHSQSLHPLCSFLFLLFRHSAGVDVSVLVDSKQKNHHILAVLSHALTQTTLLAAILQSGGDSCTACSEVMQSSKDLG